MAWERHSDDSHDGWTRTLPDGGSQGSGLLVAGAAGWCFWPDASDAVTTHEDASSMAEAMEKADLWAAEQGYGVERVEVDP